MSTATGVLLGVSALLLVVIGTLIGLLGRAHRGDGTTGPHERAALDAELAAEREALAAEVQRGARDVAVIRAEAEAASVALRERTKVELDQARERVEAQAAHLRATRTESEAEMRVLREDIRTQRADTERREHRLLEREQRLDETARAIESQARALTIERDEVAAARLELTDISLERTRILESTANLSAGEAKAELVASIGAQAKREAAIIVRDIESAARAEGDQRARSIVTGAIQRLAAEQTAESVVSVIHLPGEDMKGRIIGREGRNIRAFEAITGVNVIIDDTPEAVLLSCFDPVRREVARVALNALVTDGRIHPQRIEDVYERSKLEVERLCIRAGEAAVVAVGLDDIHPQLVALLGQLRYRTSYGQNVLKHLIESAHLAGLMAAELGINVPLVKRGAFLHDIGKALTHEVEGSHALVGADLARKYGEHEDVVHAIAAHHNEIEPRTVEAVLTQAADAISGGRPGARREALEAYVKRLERLEEIAHEHEGVEKVFAMQAGREVRVMVKPDVVDDIAAQVLARDIVKRVEDELTYPGQIRVMVVRESRAIEVAR